MSALAMATAPPPASLSLNVFLHGIWQWLFNPPEALISNKILPLSTLAAKAGSIAMVSFDQDTLGDDVSGRYPQKPSVSCLLSHIPDTFHSIGHQEGHQAGLDSIPCLCAPIQMPKSKLIPTCLAWSKLSRSSRTLVLAVWFVCSKAESLGHLAFLMGIQSCGWLSNAPSHMQPHYDIPSKASCSDSLDVATAN